ncbi:hypothetical protein EVAR_37049_1 [Eumeta japonica]|uniref:Uncharacterized protein n=1 Tax=Eumeta variegata TaxID=151549 RepID=A0A4C1WIK4_EUMVA|nr:hypothetical protein EVAR_37049_1 [Eumeta japonica]
MLFYTAESLPTNLFQLQEEVFSGFQPHTTRVTGARVCVMDFLPPPAARGEKKKEQQIASDQLALSAAVGRSPLITAQTYAMRRRGRVLSSNVATASFSLVATVCESEVLSLSRVVLLVVANAHWN